MHAPADLPPPPRSWSPARRLARAFTAPVERFLAVSAASGIVLLVAAVVALVWANSPWSAAYEALWSAPLGFAIGPWEFTRDLRWWVNDGLMAVFFFVVGLEIRREMHVGELSDARRAALPLAAALGGMILPAGIYLLFNAGRESAVGWGVPMATDIAFAVGVLALLGDRVPAALRILLLAAAVIDDLGAILVIALFYSGGVDPTALALAGVALAGIPAMQLFGVRTAAAYAVPALAAWAATYAAGIHPTIAGVLVGLLTPVQAWWGPVRFADSAEAVAREVRAAVARGQTDIHEPLHTLARAATEAVPPVERLQHALHGWVAWFVMPVFALANAGVALGSLEFGGDGWRVFAGVSLGLLVGKTVGVYAAARLAGQSGLAVVPRGVSWSGVSVVGVVAGIGFTMALFIAQLAFPPGPALETAKLAILSGSALAGVLGLLVGRAVLRPGAAAGAARSPGEAEASTEH